MMKTVNIEDCSFGTLVIDGKSYNDDLMILPDGKILSPWRRKQGHRLSMDDLKALIEAAPQAIVVGTGMSAGVIPDKGLPSDLGKQGIEFIAAPNQEAIRLFKVLSQGKKTGAGFHLTC